MKLRNFLIVLFAVLMVFALASCKHEPKVNPTPAPEEDPWELYPYKDYTPTANQVQVITITEGVEKDYWNKDKLKIEWEEPVEKGDVVTLKYRSERTIYQWDIRNGSTKWVYETSKNNFTDPVLGDGGWYTFSYTFADVDINGAELPGDVRFGIYFRGNFVEGDVFEIMDVKLNGEPLEIEASNIKSAATLAEDTIADHVWDIPRNYAVLLATGTVGEVDKTPLIEKVAPGSTVQDLYDELEEDGGYIVKLYSDADKTTAYDLSTKILKDALIVYYERTGVERTVKFDLNGGTSATPIADATVLNGQSVAKPETIPTKEGALFAEWCTDAEGTKPYDFTKAVKGNLTLYARYGVPRTVTFDLNGAEGTIAPVQVPDGMPVARPTPEPTNGPYGLETWLLGTEEYDFSTPVTGDITLKAEWSNKTVVTLNLGYGSPVTFKALLDTPLAENDENLAIKRIGYIFEGWYDDAEFNTAHNFEGNVTGPLTLYAKFSTGKMYRITSTKFTAGYDHDKFVIGFTGEGQKVKAGDTVSITFRSTEPITKFSVRKNDPSTYSKWFHEKASGDYPLFFSSMDTVDGWTTVTYTFPEPTDATQAKQIGYDAEGSGFFIYFLNSKMVPGAFMEVRAVMINGKEITLADANINHALTQCAPTFDADIEDYEWTSHTVKFEMDVAAAKEDATVEFGRYVAEPEDPTAEGYVFVGWYSDALFTKEFSFKTPIIEDTTIYAKFGAKKVVTFESNEGSAVAAIDVANGEPVAKPEDPLKAGSVFGGWYTDNGTFLAAYDFTTPVTADITLYAKWVSSKQVTLNYNYEGAPAATVVDVESGSTMAKPKNPVKVGSYFAGWFTAAEGGDAVDFTAAVTDNKTIYAHWTEPTSYSRLTATTASSRMVLRYKGNGEGLDINPKKGDVLAFKYKSNVAIDSVILRNKDGSSSTKFLYYADLEDYSIGDQDGWHTFIFTYGDNYDDNGGAASYPVNGIRLELFKDGGSFAVNDTLDIMGLSFNGEALEISGTDTSKGPYENTYPTVTPIDL